MTSAEKKQLQNIVWFPYKWHDFSSEKEKDIEKCEFLQWKSDSHMY